MDAEFIIPLLLIAVVTLAASYVQGITGFGFGIVAMIFMPTFLLFTEANVLSGILGGLGSLLIAFELRKLISFKNLLFPLIGSIVTNYLAVLFVKSAKNGILMLLLGFMLVILSIYFFFFSGKIKIRPTWYAGLIAGVISGIMSGLFSIGGPPVVVYYIHSERDTKHYLATISAYFVITGAFSTVLKAVNGFVTKNVLIGLVIGTVVMAAGTLLGKFTRERVNEIAVKRLVYAVMALSGIANIITALV